MGLTPSNPSLFLANQFWLNEFGVFPERLVKLRDIAHVDVFIGEISQLSSGKRSRILSLHRFAFLCAWRVWLK